MEKFVYDPLETSNHIRLLSFPRARNNPSNQEYTTLPTFKLIHVPLDKAPPYEALSYVWGSLEREQKILLGTREMAITENLYTALPYLIRHTNLLWMDQICINQDDNDEKSNQVLLMSKIYEKASMTIVWLGKEDGTEGDVQGLARIIDNYNAHMSFKPTVLDDVLADPASVKKARGLVVEYFEMLLASSRRDSYVRAIRQVLERPWFRRAWIVQEFVVCKSAIILIGSVRFGVRVFLAIIEAFVEAQVKSGGVDAFMMANAPGYGPLVSMVYKMEEMDGLGFPEPPHIFLNGMGCRTLASDKRDNVYAFLSLIKDARYVFSPNYNLSVWDVFIQTTITFIEGSKTLDVLGISSGVGDLPEFLPSWVPHWGGGGSRNPIYGGNPSTPFRASKSYDHTSQTAPCTRTLIVRGNVIDVIDFKFHAFDHLRWKMPINNESLFDLDEIMQKLNDASTVCVGSSRPWTLRICKEIAENLYGIRDTSHRPVTRERLLETIIAGGARGDHEQTSGSIEDPTHLVLDSERIADLLRAYDYFREVNSMTESGSQVTQDTRELATRQLTKPVNTEKLRDDLTALRRYDLVTTDKILVRGPFGKFGLAPRDVRLGDIVTILHGSKTPMILRPTEKESHYHLVGQCYWENSMYGESVCWEESEASEFFLV